jgi:two-component system, NarL family, nitrate/nitrite response regulator NarL
MNHDACTSAADVVRIVIADDHPIFRDGLKKLLETEAGFAVVGEAHDGVDAIQVITRLKPDVLLLDMAMPRMGGLETLAALDGATAPRVVVLTAAISEPAILRAVQLGARGIVLKEVATRSLLEGIRRVMRGQCVLGDEVFEDLVAAIRSPTGTSQRKRFGLSPREIQIVAGIAAGQSNKEIAEQLSISVQTVKHHLTSVFDKTGVSSRLELAAFALRNRLVDESS